jgi:hypothetical protein
VTQLVLSILLCVDIQRELAAHPDRWQHIKVRMGIRLIFFGGSLAV